MYRVSEILLLAVLSPLMALSDFSQCDYIQPRYCHFFWSNFCYWSLGDGWSTTSTHYCNTCDKKYFLEFKGARSGRVESGTACSTGGSSNGPCLKFKYWFEKPGVAYLNVIINTESGKTVVWRRSQSVSNSWNDAQVPINVKKSFTVIIEATTRDRQHADTFVRLGDVAYSFTQCTEQTPGVLPTPATQYTSSVSSQTREVPTQSTSAETSPNQHDQVGSAKSPGDVFIIVGTIVAVVVIVIIIAVLVAVMRRQLLFCRRRFKAETKTVEHSHESASRKDASSLDSRGLQKHKQVGDTSGPLMYITSSHSFGDNHNANQTADHGWTQQPEGQLYASAHKPRTPDPGVLHTPHQQPTPAPTDQLYAAVHKPRTALPGPPPTLAEPMDHSPYDITGECYASMTNGSEEEAATGIYHYLEEGRRQPGAHHALLHETPPLAGTTSPEKSCRSAQQNRQPFSSSQDQDGDYNSLELGGRRRVVEREEGEGPGHVYGGLHEGDGDAYSEVNHHRRREVIDDHYSSLAAETRGEQ